MNYDKEKNSEDLEDFKKCLLRATIFSKSYFELVVIYYKL